MDVLTGVLVDVSGSMSVNVENSEVGERGGSWAKSIFKCIDRLIAHDASDNQRVFAIAFGASRRQTIFDVLTTLKKLEIRHELVQDFSNPLHNSRTFPIGDSQAGVDIYGSRRPSEPQTRNERKRAMLEEQ